MNVKVVGFSRCGLGIAALFALSGFVNADLNFGTDLRNRGEVTFIQVNTETNDANVLTVRDAGHRGLGKVKRAAHYIGSGEQSGEVIRLTVDSAGLVTRMLASDGSGVNLKWNKKKGYREASVTMRDQRGRKISFTEIKKTFDTITEFGESPDSIVSWERVTGLNRESLANGNVFSEETGEKVVGLLDAGDRAINTIFDRVSKIPAVVEKGGALGLLIVKAITDAALATAGFQDQVKEYVGDISDDLREKGKQKVEELLADDRTAPSLLDDVETRPSQASINPLYTDRGTAIFETPEFTLKEGKSANLRIVREGGTEGILAGHVELDEASSTASLDDFLVRGKIYYLFPDGGTTPQVLNISALKDRLDEGDETLTLIHDSGVLGGFDSFTAIIQDNDRKAPVDFSLSGSGGDVGIQIGTDTGLGQTYILYLGSPISVQLSYSAVDNVATVSMSSTLRDDKGNSLSYNWSGVLPYNGFSFQGTLSRTDTANRPVANISIQADQNGRYYAAPTVPFTHLIFNSNGQTTPVKTFSYTPDSFYLD